MCYCKPLIRNVQCDGCVPFLANKVKELQKEVEENRADALQFKVGRWKKRSEDLAILLRAQSQEIIEGSSCDCDPSVGIFTCMFCEAKQNIEMLDSLE